MEDTFSPENSEQLDRYAQLIVEIATTKKDKFKDSVLIKSDESTLPLALRINEICQEEGLYSLLELRYSHDPDFYYENLIQHFDSRISTNGFAPKARPEILQRLESLTKVNNQTTTKFRELVTSGDLLSLKTYYPDLTKSAGKIWAQLVQGLFLDSETALADYTTEVARGREITNKLNQAQVRDLRLQGAGIDLRVELTPEVRFLSGESNLPSFETFFTPSPGKIFGEMHFADGVSINGYDLGHLRIKIEAGEVVEWAGSDTELLERIFAIPGANKIGEVGFVGGIGRIEELTGLVMLDENHRYSAHVALGNGYKKSNPNANKSPVHLDLVKTGLERVVATTADGQDISLI